MLVQHLKCQACRDAGHCVRTGECCHIRESLQLTDAEEKAIKHPLYQKTGVIYLYPLARYTISLTDAERLWMQAEAKTRHLAFKVLPKKVLYDAKTEKATVLDWFVDHDVCPFLESSNHCSIYANRPKICKDFPFHHLDQSNLEEIKTFISSNKVQISEEPYTVLVRKARDSLTKQGIEV